MSSFVSLDYAKRLMRDHEVKYWKIKDSDNRSVLGEFKDPESTLEQSIDMLENSIIEIQGKWINLELRSKSAKERGAGGDIRTNNYDLKVLLDSKGGINGPGAQQNSNDGLIKTLMAEIQNMRVDMLRQQHSFETASLKAELAELKEGNPMMDQVIAGLAKVFVPGAQAPGNEIPLQPASPVQQVQHLAGVEEGKNRIQSALRTLASIDSNLKETLEALARFAKKNPDQYHSYVQMLKNL